MTINVKAQKFFEDNALQWSIRGYNYIDHNYPVAFHRQRIILKILSKKNKKKMKVIDIGCGTGDNIIEIAKLGHSVVGIDSSKKMLNLAKRKIMKLKPNIRKNIHLVNESIMNYKVENHYDICICMGVIGYMDSEEKFLKQINKFLKKNGQLIISCRNRLFNLQSVSFRTLNEINKKNFKSLYDELKTYYKPLRKQSVEKFINNISKLKLKKNNSQNNNEKKYIDKKYNPFKEPKQHTPLQLKKLSIKSGFKVESYYGVHPHIIDPQLNKMLPFKMFNQLSDLLIVFEDEPISLVWSSVFIGILIKGNK